MRAITTKTTHGQRTIMNKINLTQKLSLFDDYWGPRVIGELNDQYVKVVKFNGPFTWHHHDHEDELFLVIKGRFRMEFRQNNEGPGAEHVDANVSAPETESNQSIWIEEGEMIIVPRGMEHRPVAEEECHVLLFEPASTLNTGNVENELTVHKLTTL